MPKARSTFNALSWARRNRRPVTSVLYAAIALVGYGLAYLLRFEFDIPADYARTFILTAPLLVGLRLVSNRLWRLSAERWRYVSVSDVLRLVGATTIGTGIFFILVMLWPLEPRVPRSVVLIEWLLSTYLIAAMWISYRTGFEQLRHHRSGHNGSRTRVLIVGAGEAANMLVREMMRFPTGYRPLAFVDDDPLKWGTRLQGIEIAGGIQELPRLARVRGAQEIIVAVPSATPGELRRILSACEGTRLPFKLLPGISEVLSGNVRLDQLRDVRIEDLLGREPVELELPELARDLAGRCVLITGAAGSIGSELARQVARYGPDPLLLCDQSESGLFYLVSELREIAPDATLIPVVQDITDQVGIDQVLRRYRPSRVFHAAAYKHVPLMQTHVREAIRNNVWGTWCVAEAAGRHKAEKFVLVSTDKAVSPTSVMGATKRLAELAVLELQNAHPRTSYGAVRFGNVLGSNGSVIPIFKRQIRNGQPLTLTHPDATRYFMTVSEAVQLILQASLLPDLAGHVAMLEMGEPVRILDLARNMLRLMGRGGPSDDNIRIIGLRPGEKVHEELVAPEEQARATPVPKVSIVQSTRGDIPLVGTALQVWLRALDAGREAQVVAAFRDIFPDLEVSEDLRQRALNVSVPAS